MGKNLVVSFPGGRGYEIPLLYFGAKYFEDLGYEKLFVSHPGYGDYSFDTLFENAEKVIQRVDFAAYDSVVFIAKSIGTGVACTLKEKYKIPASLIILTPVEETLPHIHGGNDISLVAAGEKDRYLDAERLKELCEKEDIPYYIEPGVGHRMEVMNDLGKNLEVIANVIGRLS